MYMQKFNLVCRLHLNQGMFPNHTCEAYLWNTPVKYTSNILVLILRKVFPWQDMLLMARYAVKFPHLKDKFCLEFFLMIFNVILVEW